jgi:hypothetical protein
MADVTEEAGIIFGLPKDAAAVRAGVDGRLA